MNELDWFESTYHRYVDFCFKLGRNYMRNMQDDGILYDMVQEVFVLLWVKRKELMEHPNIGGWLALAVRYRMLNHHAEIRKQRLHRAYSIDAECVPEIKAMDLTPEQCVELQSKVDELRRFLGEEDASLFLAYAAEGYKAKDLSRKYQLPENTVYMRIHRIKKKLAAHPELFYALILASIGVLNL